jgi:hypothetical protein
MKLISRVTCRDEVFGCDYALIDLTAALARVGLKRIAVLKDHKRIDNQLYQMYFWESNVEYFSPWTVEEEGSGDALAEAIRQCSVLEDDWMAAPAGFAVPESLIARMECCRMAVGDAAISFVAIPKHTDFTVSTGELPVRVLQAAAA